MKVISLLLQDVMNTIKENSKGNNQVITPHILGNQIIIDNMDYSDMHILEKLVDMGVVMIGASDDTEETFSMYFQVLR